MEPKKKDNFVVVGKTKDEEKSKTVTEENKKPLVKFSVQKSMFNF